MRIDYVKSVIGSLEHGSNNSVIPMCRKNSGVATVCSHSIREGGGVAAQGMSESNDFRHPLARDLSR